MPHPGPFDGTIKGTCDGDCQDRDDAGCGPCVEQARMAWACRCTCLDLQFRAVPQTAPHEECNCSTGTVAPGNTIIGALIGWTRLDSALMDELRAAAMILSGSDTVKLRLYGNGTSGGPELRCNVGTAGWMQLPLNEAGDMILVNPPGGEIVFDSGAFIGGATSLLAEQLGIEVDPVEGGTGTDCATIGGHRMFKAIFSTDGGGGDGGNEDITIVECKFDGITGAPPCTAERCCNWGLSAGPNVSTDGTDAEIAVTYTRPSDCECAPDAVLTIDDGVNEPDVHFLTVSPTFITFDVFGYLPGQTVTFTLEQVYTDCEATPPCDNSSNTIPVTL